jgi:hypothetical protein
VRRVVLGPVDVGFAEREAADDGGFREQRRPPISSSPIYSPILMNSRIKRLPEGRTRQRKKDNTTGGIERLDMRFHLYDPRSSKELT